MGEQSFILVLNCGSSSLKGGLLDIQKKGTLLSWVAERLDENEAFITFKDESSKRRAGLNAPHSHVSAVEAILAELGRLDLLDRVAAIGHRVVHGGERFTESCVISEEVMHDIQACVSLAPLHNPAQILGIEAAQKVFPKLLQVAVFDTAFHQTMPEHAYRYAVPETLYTEHGLRRYGMHGISYRFVTQETARLLGRDAADLALVIAHLGNGASIAAIKGGQSCDTSMGLTPLEGLVMGTRSGDIDPGLFSFLQENLSMSIDEITKMLNQKSGLIGLSGLSNDCRVLEKAALEGHVGANLALNVFAYRLAKYIGAMAVAAGRLDALVFTGGIGENSALLREKVLQLLGVLGLLVDKKANENTCFGRAGVISTANSAALSLVVPTNEELMIAQDTAALAGLKF